MAELFSIHMPVWEIVVRGTLIYWFLLLIFRFVLRRDTGSVGLADILMVVLIADAAQNGMSGEYKSIGEGFILIGTIVSWNALIDWMSYRFDWFKRFAEAEAVVLVTQGRILKQNLQREMITPDELQSHVRAAGLENVRQVRKAVFESDGTISIVPRRPRTGTANRKKEKTPGAA